MLCAFDQSTNRRRDGRIRRRRAAKKKRSGDKPDKVTGKVEQLLMDARKQAKRGQLDESEA